VLAGEANGKFFASLVDRNRLMQKRPQLYAMDFSILEKAKIVFSPIEAPESLNARRREIGLEPFVCYINAMTLQKKLPAVWPEGVPYEPAYCNSR